MAKKSKKQQEIENEQYFSVMELLLLALVIGIVGFLGFQVYSLQQDVKDLKGSQAASQIQTPQVQPENANQNQADTSKEN